MKNSYVTPMTKKEVKLYRKINKLLAKKGDSWRSPDGFEYPMYKLCKSRGYQMYTNVGRFYILDVIRNFIHRPNVDLKDFYDYLTNF